MFPRKYDNIDLQFTFVASRYVFSLPLLQVDKSSVIQRGSNAFNIAAFRSLVLQRESNALRPAFSFVVAI
jgi:hypothetical protein